MGRKQRLTLAQVRPDDLKKAHKDMEKVVENGHAEVKKIVEAARKAMEQS